jgi:UDPglucose 6-dehydrogenase
VIGAGYVGATSAAVLAYLGNHVTCVEREPARLESWRSGTDPLCEPGLAELLANVDVGFVSEPDGLGRADVIVIAVGTPMGQGGRPDLAQVDAAAAQIGARARKGAVVLMRSTVPVGTCDRLQAGPLRDQHVVSNPEFLREGHALQDAFFPDRIVAGGPEARHRRPRAARSPACGRAAGAPLLDERGQRRAVEVRRQRVPRDEAQLRQ